jgi:hypothetical protein
MTDMERLDWLEANHADADAIPDEDDGAPYWRVFGRVCVVEAPTLRAAIDKAMDSDRKGEEPPA